MCKQGNNAEVLFPAGSVMFPCLLLTEKLLAPLNVLTARVMLFLPFLFLFRLLEKKIKI